jgi:hypothetical protein
MPAPWPSNLPSLEYLRSHAFGVRYLKPEPQSGYPVYCVQFHCVEAIYEYHTSFPGTAAMLYINLIAHGVPGHDPVASIMPDLFNWTPVPI